MKETVKKIIVNTIAIVLCMVIWIVIITLVDFSTLGVIWKYFTVGVIISLCGGIWSGRSLLLKCLEKIGL